MRETLSEPTTAAGARRPRLGFLGLGWIGLHRLRAVVESGIAEVAALADPSAEARAGAEAAAGGAPVVDGLDPLLDLGLDGIVVATPSALHAEQATAALERGLAVFCQKPLGRTAPEVAGVIETARRNDRLLGVDLSYRFTRAVQAIRRRLREGVIGDVHAVELAFHNAYGPDKPWFYDRRLSGGGCVIDLGIHLVDLALWVLGHPRVVGVESRIFAAGALLRPPIDAVVEDHAAALIDLEGGDLERRAVATLACSWKLPLGADCAIEAGFFGSRGGLALRNVAGSFYDLRAELYRGRTREVIEEPPDAWGGRAVVDWARRLRSGARYDAGVEGLVQVHEVLDRIYGRDAAVRETRPRREGAGHVLA